MAPTYKDLAKSWLSNWLPGVCVQRLRKSVPPVRVYVCVSALIRKKESWLRPGGRGHKLCFDRFTLDAVTHYTKKIASSKKSVHFPSESFLEFLSFSIDPLSSTQSLSNQISNSSNIKCQIMELYFHYIMKFFITIS